MTTYRSGRTASLVILLGLALVACSPAATTAEPSPPDWRILAGGQFAQRLLVELCQLGLEVTRIADDLGTRTGSVQVCSRDGVRGTCTTMGAGPARYQRGLSTIDAARYSSGRPVRTGQARR